MLKTKRQLFFYRLVLTICLIAAVWLILTLWVQRKGTALSWYKPGKSGSQRVLVVFDPDPIYNLDERVCLAFSNGLSRGNIDVVVQTVAAIDESKVNEFDAYVICANTYNWQPDWAIKRFISRHKSFASKPIVAITVGSGSTRSAQQSLEKLISSKGGKLVASNAYWLMRPNNEKLAGKSNVEVATSLAFEAGLQVADSLNH